MAQADAAKPATSKNRDDLTELPLVNFAKRSTIMAWHSNLFKVWEISENRYTTPT